MLRTKINRVICFGSSVTELFAADDPEPNGHVVLLDTSTSMGSKRSETKLCLSALRCLDSQVQGRLEVPEPHGNTKLVAALEELLPGVGPLETVTIITDGHDTDWKGTPLIAAGFDEDGNRVFSDLPPYPAEGDAAEKKAYFEARQTAVLDYLENVAKCQVHLVGVGIEVKAFVEKAAKRKKLVAAHVSPGASAVEVASVVRASIDEGAAKKSQRAAAAAGGGDETGGGEAGEAAEAAVITHLSAPAQAALLQITPDEASRVAAGASNVVIGQTLDVGAFKATFEAAERDAGLGCLSDGDRKYTRAAVLWYMEKIVENDSVSELPGALLGGKRSGVFAPPPSVAPPSAWSGLVNRLLAILKMKSVLTGGRKCADEVAVALDLPGAHGRVSLKYTDAAMYGIAGGVKLAVVKAARVDSTWASPEAALLVSAKKRARS
jgi:hypothetical protein